MKKVCLRKLESKLESWEAIVRTDKFGWWVTPKGNVLLRAKASGEIKLIFESFHTTTDLREMFFDPLNVTKEEAELFKLERGFDYPRELIDDL